MQGFDGHPINYTATAGTWAELIGSAQQGFSLKARVRWLAACHCQGHAVGLGRHMAASSHTPSLPLHLKGVPASVPALPTRRPPLPPGPGPPMAPLPCWPPWPRCPAVPVHQAAEHLAAPPALHRHADYLSEGRGQHSQYEHQPGAYQPRQPCQGLEGADQGKREAAASGAECHNRAAWRRQRHAAVLEI